MTLSEVRGQEEAVAFFLRAVRKERLGHAYLLLGPEGVGRGLFARAAASYLLCESAGDPAGAGCGKCGPCLKVAGDTHPDVRQLKPEEGSRILSIDQIRDLQRILSRKPGEGKFRVFILHQADRMTPYAANCFLKTLEEPPSYALLFLLATNLALLPPTTVSRCQVLRFPPLSQEVTVDILSGLRHEPREELEFAARMSGGSAGRAIALLEDSGRETRDRLLKAILDPAHAGRSHLTLARELEGLAGADRGKRAEKRAALAKLLDLLLSVYRDLHALEVHGKDAELFNEDRREEIARWAEGLPPGRPHELLDATLTAKHQLELNANIPLTLENLLYDLATLQTKAS